MKSLLITMALLLPTTYGTLALANPEEFDSGLRAMQAGFSFEVEIGPRPYYGPRPFYGPGPYYGPRPYYGPGYYRPVTAKCVAENYRGMRFEGFGRFTEEASRSALNNCYNAGSRSCEIRWCR